MDLNGRNISTILLLLSLFLIDWTLALKNTKECDIKHPIDKCLKYGFLFDNKGKRFDPFPTTMEGLNKGCEEVKKAEQCSADFIAKCTDNSYEQRVLTHLLEGRHRVMKRICRTNTKKQLLLDNVQCANAVIDDTYNCVGDYQKLVFAANKLDDKHKILRILCCKIREVVPCVGKAMKKKASVCPQKSIDYFENMRVTIREEMTSVVCADFERDNCKNVEVPSVSADEYQGKALYEPMRQLYRKVLP